MEAGTQSGLLPGFGVTDKPVTPERDATAARHHFSKVLYIVTLYSKCTMALTPNEFVSMSSCQSARPEVWRAPGVADVDRIRE